MKRKNFMSRALSAILAAAVVVTGLSVDTKLVAATTEDAQPSVYVSEQSTEENEVLDSETETNESQVEHATGAKGHQNIHVEAVKDEYGKTTAAVKDAKYRNKKVTPIKDQGGWNYCWSFSSASAIESELWQNEGVAYPNMSEIQTAYFVYNPAQDPLGQMHAGEYKTNQYIVNEGGWQEQVIAALASGMCGTDEMRVPLKDAHENTVLSADKAYTGELYLKKALFIDQWDTKSIKQAILDYGSVVMNFSYYSDCCDDDNGTIFYNGANTKEDASGHAVQIIGWDDNFSRKKFTSGTPRKNGAWIIKNSWGTDFGDNGYYYMSYEDESMWPILYAYDVELGSLSDNIYQYDFDYNPTSDFDLPCPAANVFTVHATGSDYEMLRHVSFMTLDANADYHIEIYTNLTSDSDPTSGTLAKTIDGSIGAAGYYTVDVKNGVRLDAGTKYSIVVSLSYPEEREGYYGLSAEVNGWIDEGETFVYVDNTWQDLTIVEDLPTDEESFEGNVKIKAYTDTVRSSTVPNKITLSKDNLVVERGNTATLSATLNGTSYDHLSWSSSNESVATVSNNGTVTGKKDGISKVTVKAMDAGNDVLATRECYVRVHEKPTSIKLNKTSLKKKLYQYDTLEPTIGPSTVDTSLGQFEWKSSNSDVVWVDSDGNIYPSEEGKATITVTYNDLRGTALSAKCTVTVVDQYQTRAKMSKSTKNSITLKWNKVNQEGYNGYAIYRSTKKNKGYKLVKAIRSKKVTSYTDKKLKAGTTYYYKVKAAWVNGNGEVEDSYYQQKVTTAITRPDAVKKLKVASTSKNKIKVTWKKAAGASGYYVYAKSSKNGKYKLIKTIKNGKTQTFTYSGLKKNKEYYIKVVPYKTCAKKNYKGSAAAVKGKTKK